MFYMKGLIGFIIFYVFTLFHRSESVEGENVCKTFNQEEGVCKKLLKCDIIMNELKKAKKDNSLKSFNPSLTFCGYSDGQPKICCPLKRLSLSNKLFNPDVLPSPPNCGLSNSLTNVQSIPGTITKTESGSWPWIAQIGYRIEKQLKSWICGGVLVSNRYVMTAAHCSSFYKVQIYPNPQPSNWLTKIGIVMKDLLKLLFSFADEIGPKNMIVRLGASQVRDGADGEIAPLDVLVEKIFIHPGYNKKTLENDIALIKLMQDIEFTPSIQPICLPQSDNLMTSDYTNYFPVAAGWGTVLNRMQTSISLRETRIPVLPLNVCNTVYKYSKLNISADQICTGFAHGGKNYCLEDSGGPLMLPIDGVTYLIGIESFGLYCAETGRPELYTRVSNYLPWIARTMENNSHSK